MLKISLLLYFMFGPARVSSESRVLFLQSEDWAGSCVTLTDLSPANWCCFSIFTEDRSTESACPQEELHASFIIIMGMNLKAQCVNFSSIEWFRKHIANNANIKACLLMSCLISRLSYKSCDVRLKSQKNTFRCPTVTHVLGYCWHVVVLVM